MLYQKGQGVQKNEWYSSRGRRMWLAVEKLVINVLLIITQWMLECRRAFSSRECIYDLYVENTILCRFQWCFFGTSILCSTDRATVCRLFATHIIGRVSVAWIIDQITEPLLETMLHLRMSPWPIHWFQTSTTTNERRIRMNEKRSAAWPFFSRRYQRWKKMYSD